MFKLNYLDSPRLLYRMGISFYKTEIIRNGNNKISGMQISLIDPLTREQAKFLDMIDTFYEISSNVVIFKSFSQCKRESNILNTSTEAAKTIKP